MISKVGLQHVISQTSDGGRVLNGEDDLHAMIEIAKHEIRAAQMNFFLAAVTEIEDAAMLQVPAQSAADLDILTHALQSGLQTADAAHEQIHLHADPGCRIEQLDNPRVN
jgi:hypothetical protein